MGEPMRAENVPPVPEIVASPPRIRGWHPVRGSKDDLEVRPPTAEERERSGGLDGPVEGITRRRYTDVFRPRWPEGLKEGETYHLPCDDVRQAHLAITIMGGDAFVHVYEPKDEDHPEGGGYEASIRIRNWFGGGRSLRSHQALLWLAEAIRRDQEDGGEGAPLGHGM